MSAEQVQGSANAFARMMLLQTSSASIISPTTIIINDGSLDGSISAADTCPNFSSAYIVVGNSSSCASQKNSVETHFVISRRTKRDNRTNLGSATCSFCGSIFSATNQTKMRIHLTGKRGSNESCSMLKSPSIM